MPRKKRVRVPSYKGRSRRSTIYIKGSIKRAEALRIINELSFLLKNLPEKSLQIKQLANKFGLPFSRPTSPLHDFDFSLAMRYTASISHSDLKELMALRKEAMEKIAKEAKD